MKERLNHIVYHLNKEFWLYLAISVGIIFFVYIFNPFTLDQIDDNNRKIFKVGLGVIVFLSMFFVRIVYPGCLENTAQREKKTALSSLCNGFIIWILSCIASIIYMHYAGLISLSPYLVFRAIIICLAPPLILAVYDKIQELKRQIDALIIEGKNKQRKIDHFEEEHLSQSIDFPSENKNDNTRMLVGDILFFKSSDNYVEVHYMEGELSQKKLIRNTLRNIELQLKPFSSFIRCHRNCIINIYHIDNASTICKDHAVVIRAYGAKIPVSRQYLLKIKEAL